MRIAESVPPVFILATYGEDGTPDAMNAAWGGISDDKQLSMCISAGHKTTANILARKAFTVSMATAEHVVSCDYVGIVSGNRVADKVARAGWHTTRSEFVDAPLIDEDVYKRQPYYLVFHWSTWYVWGWCQTREDFRLFKLNRMTEPASGEPFEPRPAPLPDLEPERIFPVKYQVTILFDPACRWRLVEEYGADRFTVEPDGRLRFTGGFPDADSILSWVLTFGDKAELLEPQELREQLGDLTETLADRYRGKN